MDPMGSSGDRPVQKLSEQEAFPQSGTNPEGELKTLKQQRRALNFAKQAVLLQKLRDQRKPMTVDQLAKGTDMTAQTVRANLQHLKESGLVSATRTPYSPYLYAAVPM
jgi:Fic family protein